MFRLIRLLAIFVLFAPFSSFAGGGIKIYAAASMSDVMKEITEKYSQQTGERITPIFAGSSSLARQIENGAPADIYISANEQWVDYLVEKKRVDKSKVNIIAQNQLVLVSSLFRQVDAFDCSDASVWSQLLKGERIAMGQTDSVPAGIYAKQSLINLGVWDTVRYRIAPTNSVRIALALVERGEALLGVVYKTDAVTNDKVSIMECFFDVMHDPITYPMAVINSQPAVEKFANYLLSHEAKQIFKAYGFQ